MFGGVKRYCKGLLHTLKSVKSRDKIILSNNEIPAKQNQVNLHWWRSNEKDINIGDYISSVVFEWMKKQNGIFTDNSKDGKTKHVYGIGSIIGIGYQDAIVWGSGILKSREKKYWWRIFRKLDIRSVRGPKTRKLLLEHGYNCPEIYGDPAILMPFIYMPKDQVKKIDYLLVLHFSHSCDFKNILSTATDDYKKFIDTIVSAEVVVSSSLHGIILAEAYGVPAIWLKTDSLDSFKYYDYYESTGRENISYATSIEEAMSMTVPSVPDLTCLHKGIIEAFPVDLWER